MFVVSIWPWFVIPSCFSRVIGSSIKSLGTLEHEPLARFFRQSFSFFPDFYECCCTSSSTETRILCFRFRKYLSFHYQNIIYLCALGIMSTTHASFVLLSIYRSAVLITFFLRTCALWNVFVLNSWFRLDLRRHCSMSCFMELFDSFLWKCCVWVKISTSTNFTGVNVLSEEVKTFQCYCAGSTEL